LNYNGVGVGYMVNRVRKAREQKMGKKSYLAMRRDQGMESSLLASDFQDLTNAAKKRATHAVKLGGLGFGMDRCFCCYVSVL
jgi:hypothetical protein